MNLKYQQIIQEFFYSESMGEYSLENITRACAYFGNPDHGFRSIHIAGTNGKGSVAKMIFQILKDSGEKVGVYTSPHLVDICERFETENGRISQHDFAHYAEKIHAYTGKLSYFEKCVLLSFLYFKDQKCRYVIVETGLGGRLDASNVIHPILSIITSIGYDHMEYLGNTLEEISREKAGIIKQGVPLILYGKNTVIQERAAEKDARIIFPSQDNISTNLLGAHQQGNARLAYQAGKFLGYTDIAIRKSLEHTQHCGRLEYVRENIVLDGAHNQQGMEALRSYIDSISAAWNGVKYYYNCKKDKDITALLEVFPDISAWNIVSTDMYLVESSEILEQKFKKRSRTTQCMSVEEIYMQANGNPQVLHVIFGSLYMLEAFYEKNKQE